MCVNSTNVGFRGAPRRPNDREGEIKGEETEANSKHALHTTFNPACSTDALLSALPGHLLTSYSKLIAVLTAFQ